MTSSSQLYPEVVDATTLGSRYSQPIYLPIGIEGQIDPAGTSDIGHVETVTRPSDADSLFGPVSSLAAFTKFLLLRGVAPVYAAPSKKTGAPLLADRQAAWALLESNRDVRIRLTDSPVQADIVALADSCENAALINNKQFSFCGMASGTSKAALITAAGAIASTRGVLVGPAVYDDVGTLKSGAYAAAAVAAEVAKNPDPSDDLDLFLVPGLSGIEKDATGNDLFRVKVVSGSAVNDFEDLLQTGVSPLSPGLHGGVAITHLRMAYTVGGDKTWDALMTRIIVDQIFVLIRDKALEFLFLRKANTETNRQLLASLIDALLQAHQDWIQKKIQNDGQLGYGVSVTSSVDGRQMIISYSGVVSRNTQTILVDGDLTIPV